MQTERPREGGSMSAKTALQFLKTAREQLPLLADVFQLDYCEGVAYIDGFIAEGDDLTRYYPEAVSAVEAVDFCVRDSGSAPARVYRVGVCDRGREHVSVEWEGAR